MLFLFACFKGQGFHPLILLKDPERLAPQVSMTPEVQRLLMKAAIVVVVIVAAGAAIPGWLKGSEYK